MNLTDPGVLVPLSIATLAFGLALPDVAPAMGTGDRQGCGTNGAATALGVRRLTPTECERLQGFPDGWTAIEHNGKPAADGPRYRALWNSMATPVVRWIGERIEAAIQHEDPTT